MQFQPQKQIGGVLCQNLRKKLLPAHGQESRLDRLKAQSKTLTTCEFTGSCEYRARQILQHKLKLFVCSSRKVCAALAFILLRKRREEQ
jgi:hypothetical protein